MNKTYQLAALEIQPFDPLLDIFANLGRERAALDRAVIVKAVYAFLESFVHDFFDDLRSELSVGLWCHSVGRQDFGWLVSGS